MLHHNTIQSQEQNDSVQSNTSLLFLLQKLLENCQNPLLTLHSENGKHQFITGEQIWNKALEYSCGLKQIGICPGDRLACCLVNGVDFIALFIACLHVKATFCPLAESDGPQSESFLLKRMEAIDPRLVLCNSSIKINTPYQLDVCNLTQTQSSLLRKMSRSPSEDLSLILWGSSAEYAKAIGFTETNLLHQVHALREEIGIQKEEKVCSYISWSCSLGFVVEMLLGLVSRANLICYYPKHFNGDILLNFVAQHPESYIFGWGSIFRRLSSSPKGRKWLKTSKGGVIVTQAVLPLSLYGCESLKELNSNFRQGYYITEATSLVSLAEKGNYTPDFIGKSVGCYMKISSRGTLMIRGASVSKTIWSGSSDAIEKGWLDTGDLVKQHPDGTYIFQGSLSRTWKWSNGDFYNPYPFEKDLRARSQEEVVIFKGNKDKHCIIVISPDQSVLEAFTESERKHMIWVHSEEVKHYKTGARWFYEKLAKYVMENYITEPLEEELTLDRTLKVRIGYKYTLSVEQLFNYIESPNAHLTLSADTEWAMRRADDFANKKHRLYSKYLEQWNYHPRLVYRKLISSFIDPEDPFLSHDMVLGTMVARLRSLAQGKSGATKSCFDWLTEACKMRLTPYIPLHKSKDVSTHMFYALVAWSGQGHFVTEEEKIISAKEFMRENHIRPIPLTARDIMVLSNDSILSMGIASAAFSEYVKVLASMIAISGLFYNCFGVDMQSINYYDASDSSNTKIVNLLRRTISSHSQILSDSDENLSEEKDLSFIQSLPKILDSKLDHMVFNQKMLEKQLNGVKDQIIFDAVAGQVLEEKNTFNHKLYFTSRSLNDLCTQTKDMINQFLQCLGLPKTLERTKKEEDCSSIGLGADPIQTFWDTYKDCQFLQAPIGELLLHLKHYMSKNKHPLLLDPNNECLIFMNQMQDKNYSSEELKKLFDSFVDLNTPFIIRKEILKSV